MCVCVSVPIFLFHLFLSGYAEVREQLGGDDFLPVIVGNELRPLDFYGNNLNPAELSSLWSQTLTLS